MKHTYNQREDIRTSFEVEKIYNTNMAAYLMLNTNNPMANGKAQVHVG